MPFEGQAHLLAEEMPLLWRTCCSLALHGSMQVFANRAFSFPFAQYEAEGRHMVLGGTLREVLSGNGYSAPFVKCLLPFSFQQTAPMPCGHHM